MTKGDRIRMRGRWLLAMPGALAALYSCSSSAPPSDSAAGADASSAQGASDSAMGGSSGSSDDGASSGSHADDASSGDSSDNSNDASSGDSETIGTPDSGGMASAGPCDLYGSAGTPCVAAHSTVRALYGAYGGMLYQVKRASDKTTKDIGVLSSGGFADGATQDTFCAGTTCTISIIYDQSSKGNHLRSAPAGGNKPTPDNEANATALKLTVNGHSVYAVHIPAGVGYRNDKTAGIATGDAPETEYMVTSGTYYNAGCCFDYGNAETTNNDDGAGTMEAVYFGNSTGWGKGAGNGPWVMADLENGLFAGSSTAANAKDTPLTAPYVTAMVKGRSGGFGLKGGNAQSGTLTTVYDGARPGGYTPMKKEGAIILGIGGTTATAPRGTSSKA
jgi:non-reducing end alpha-L-arabinofuranosidase